MILINFVKGIYYKIIVKLYELFYRDEIERICKEVAYDDLRYDAEQEARRDYLDTHPELREEDL